LRRNGLQAEKEGHTSRAETFFVAALLAAPYTAHYNPHPVVSASILTVHLETGAPNTTVARVRSACALIAAVALTATLVAVDPAPTPTPGPADTQEPPGAAENSAPASTNATVDSLGVSVVLQTIDGSLELPTSQLAELSCDEELRTCNLPDQKVPIDELLFLRFPWSEAPSEPLAVRLLLRTGDALVGRIEGGDEESLSLRVASLGSGLLSVPIGQVKGWLRHEPRTAGRDEPVRAARQRQLERRVQTEMPTDDLFVLLEGGEIRGLLEELDSTKVRVSSETLGNEDEGIDVPYERLRAVILTEVDLSEGESSAPQGDSAAGRPQARLQLRDGSRIAVTLEGLSAGQLRGRHAHLGRLELALEEILDVAFLSGRARYLSDLEPLETEERLGPAFLLRRPYRRDANVLGGPLRLGQRTFEKGLGVHAYSRLHFHLGGEFGRFQAVVGLDAAAHPRDPEVARSDVGSVVFRVRVDGELSFEKAMTWRDEPLQLELPVAGRQLLILEVDYGGPPGSTNFALDRADWADARVLKSRS
jgi:hypothetical protein